MKNPLLTQMFEYLPLDDKFHGMTYKKFMNLIKKNEPEIRELVEAFASEEGVEQDSVEDALEYVVTGNFSKTFNSYPLFLVTDALGCDDLGYRESNEELDFIYQTLWTYWGHTSAGRTHV